MLHIKCCMLHIVAALLRGPAQGPRLCTGTGLRLLRFRRLLLARLQQAAVSVRTGAAEGFRGSDCTKMNILAHTHTHTSAYIYIYRYICICM